MARAKEGLVIEEGEEPIVAFFFMLGLPEDPGLHLRLMAALAVAAEQPGFLEDWKAAASTTELKELFVPSDEETATAGEPVLLPA
jgi:mannitol/fructose-specific phosphotransferase system IIA component (Ntr-type)